MTNNKRKRGYFGVGLDSPKTNDNIGGAMRACGCYDANFLVASNKRYNYSKLDTGSYYKHIPFFPVDSLIEFAPKDCQIIAVDILPFSKNIKTFVHPERAFYIFGAEDRTLDISITKHAHHIIHIPTSYCMNLAACVNVVLYDRMIKSI